MHAGVHVAAAVRLLVGGRVLFGPSGLGLTGVVVCGCAESRPVSLVSRVVRPIDVSWVDAGGRGGLGMANSGSSVVGPGRRLGLAGATKPVGVSAGESPGAVALVLAAELVTLGGIIARGGPVPHFC